ncbi:hypothetical protein [Candidatus Hodgkinia cicadicola]|uniref:hypothetical protein n=1 Tax=Candidatus Hodgkinia cicadicola TaxID=573658 RepID=UPI0011BAB978
MHPDEGFDLRVPTLVNTDLSIWTNPFINLPQWLPMTTFGSNGPHQRSPFLRSTTFRIKRPRSMVNLGPKDITSNIDVNLIMVRLTVA